MKSKKRYCLEDDKKVNHRVVIFIVEPGMSRQGIIHREPGYNKDKEHVTVELECEKCLSTSSQVTNGIQEILVRDLTARASKEIPFTS